MALLLFGLCSPTWANPQELVLGDCPIFAGQARLWARHLVAQAVAVKNHQLARFYLETAYQLSPAPQLLYNLGVVALRDGQNLLALDLLSRAAAELGPAFSAEHVQALKEAEHKARPHRTLLLQTTPGAFVFLDGHLIGQAPLPTPVLLSRLSHRLLIERGYQRAELLLSEQTESTRLVRTVSLPQPLLLLAPELEAETRASLQAHLAAEGLLLIPAEDRELLLQRFESRSGCLTQTQCQLYLAEQLSAQRLLVVRTVSFRTKTERQQTSLSFEVLSVPQGATLFSRQVQCPNCTSSRMDVYLGALSRLLKRELPELTGSALQTEEPPPRGFADRSVSGGSGVSSVERCALWWGTARQFGRRLLATQVAGENDHDLQARLEVAYRVSPAPVLLYNLGLLAARQGHAVTAADLLHRFLACGGGDLTEERKNKIDHVLSEHRQPSASVAVSGPTGSQVFVNGRLHGSLPLLTPLILPFGQHVVVVENGYRTAQKVVSVQTAEAQVLKMELPEATLLLSDDPVMAENPALWTVVERAAEAEGRVVIHEAERDRLVRNSAEFAACEKSLFCMRRLGKMLGAQSVVSFSRKTGAWSGRLFDTTDGALGTANSAECRTCKTDDLALRNIVRSLFSRQHQARSAPTLEVDPPGRLFLDGLELGAPPQKPLLLAGVYRVEAIRSPSERLSAWLRVPWDTHLSLRFFPTKTPKRRRNPTIGVSLLATSAVFLATSIGLFASYYTAGEPANKSLDDSPSQSQRHPAALIATPLFLLGSAATATAGGLWFGLRSH